MVIIVLAVIIWGVRALLGALASDDGAAEPAAAPSATETSRAGTESDTPGADADDPATDSGEPGAEPGQCHRSDIDLRLLEEPDDATAGSSMDFTVQLRNNGDQPCLVEVGPERPAVAVTSGEDEIWASADCTDAGSQELLLDVEGDHEVSRSWDGGRLGEDCADDDEAQPGSYRVHLSWAGDRDEEQSATFSLTD